MESEGPAATLSMSSLPHPEIRYEAYDADNTASGSNIRCTPLTSGGAIPDVVVHQLNGHLTGDDRHRGTPASSPVTGTTDEPMEVTSESEPERSHSSHSESAGGGATVAALLDDAESPAGTREGQELALDDACGSPSAYRGKIICNADGVICFIDANPDSGCDVSKCWPAFSSSYIHDSSSSSSSLLPVSSSSSSVPSVLFPFHTLAHIPATSECTVRFFQSPAAGADADEVLDLYQNLPLSYVESQRPPLLLVCLVCAPLLFEDEATFLQHAQSVHNLPVSANNCCAGIIQRCGTDRDDVTLTWMRLRSVNTAESASPAPVPLTEPVSSPAVLAETVGETSSAGAADTAEAASDEFVESVPLALSGIDAPPLSSSMDDDLTMTLPSEVADSAVVVPDEMGDAEAPPLRVMTEEPLAGEEVAENGLLLHPLQDDSDSLHSFAEDLMADHAHHHDHEEGGLVNGNGKSSSIECPKCDIVLGSSKSLGGHMTMVHSRNSSKTLKCPKCNWHYKYQETLEIHMKEKHPESEETCPYCLTGQAHPRLARGEVYSCGYKPYRCDICNYSTTSKGNLTIHMQSDKHVNNVQDRHTNGGPSTSSSSATTASAGERTGSPAVEEVAHTPIARSASTSSAAGRAPFRCDMCGYETNVSRNLRIHMTSEKHQQNANMFLQARIQELAMQTGGGMGMMDQATMMQLMGMSHLDVMSSAYRPPSGPTAVTSSNGEPSSSSKRPPSVKIPDNALPFQCLICMHFMTDSLEELQEHITRDRSDASRHLPAGGELGEGGENTGVVNGQSYCKCCQYTTKLKANFQLHCKTDKHVQKMQLVNHVREGGPDNAWRLQYLNTSNPVQVRCNACDYQTTSLSQLRVHTDSSVNHELNVAALQRISQFAAQQDLQNQMPDSTTVNRIDATLSSSSPETVKADHDASSALIPSSSSSPPPPQPPPSSTTRKWKLFCSLCTFTAKSQQLFMQHIRSPGHLTRWRQYAKNPFPAATAGTTATDLPDLAFFISAQPVENLAADANVQELFEASQRNGNGGAGQLHRHRHLSGCSDGDEDSGREDHLSSSDEADQEDFEGTNQNGHHSNHSRRHHHQASRSQNRPHQHRSKPAHFVCPLCQDPSKGREALESHLISKHNVHSAEALERLMMLVIAEANFPSRDPSPSTSDEEDAAGGGKTSSHTSDTSDIYRCQKCAVTFTDIDQLYGHQNASGHLELKQTPRGPGYLCWKKGCNQYFKSANSLQMHFREIHAKKGGGGAGEGSGDEAGMMTDENSQSGEVPTEGDDEVNSQALAEAGYRDHYRKYKCHRCKVAYTKQIYLTAHNKTLQHRKGEKSNYPMEKYLDPNRPHKCEVCKESFTQKNILLVHYNSVSHLHKKKKYHHQNDLADSREQILSPEHNRTPPSAHPSPPSHSTSAINRQHNKHNGLSDSDSKPFRCRVCQIGYTNSATLDIHIRSVGHQTKAARASQQAAQESATAGGSAVDLSKPVIEEGSVRATGVRNVALPLKMEIDREEDEEPPQRNGQPSERSRQEAPDANGNGRARIFGRPRGNVGWSSMLENIGLEMVQHYMEAGQKVARKPKDTTMEPVEGENQIPSSTVDNQCLKCHKIFTSPWILKVHRESSHGDIVPVRVLETVASEYRKAHSEKPQKKRSLPEQATTGARPATATPITQTASNGETSSKKRPLSPQQQASSSSSTHNINNTANGTTFNAADLLAAQMQLFMYPGMAAMNGLSMMGMQAAMMNLQPPLINANGQFALSMDPQQQSRGNGPSNQQTAAANARAAALLEAQSGGQKRNRTRITDEQLQILRLHFDIRNPPSDELLQTLCGQTGLELKVVKHWYRNTLFKERQRNKDSPYNFSVPPNPSTAPTEVQAVEDVAEELPADLTPPAAPTLAEQAEEDSSVYDELAARGIKREPSVESVDSRPSYRESSMTYNPTTPSPTPMHLLTDAMREERNSGKRANRTRFTDFQVKALQEYFDKNAYPKDDDLEELSRVLGLSPRVITVWFQNARQKARKSYENTTPPQVDEAPPVRTPSLNYQCKKCLQVFQRYYELIRHQRVQCSGTSAGMGNGSGGSGSGGSVTNGRPGDRKDVDETCSVTSATESVSSSKAELPSSSSQPLERAVWDPSVPSVTAMLSPSPFMFPGLYPPNSPFGVLQMEAISNAAQSRMSSPSPVKRRQSSEDDDEESPSNKRVRTTIQPEQLDYLYQQYRLDSNPSRKQLELIATKTNLKKRVVQVWYQNTRARERKGQLNLHQMAVSKRCPVCRLHFSVRAALETHIAVKHADVYCKGEINIDDLPDTAGESDAEEKSAASSPVPQRRRPSPQPAVPSVTSMNESMKRYYEDVMKKFMDGPNVLMATAQVPVPSLTLQALPVATTSKQVEKQQQQQQQSARQADAPLDLSAPHPKAPLSLVSGQYFSGNEDSRSFAVDEDGDDEDNRSVSSNTMGMGGSRAGKRFRTQMSNAQLKVMKRLFTEYKTPTMGECELVGREIGLPKRVVQVWFQNARAKEKKNRLAGVEPEKGPTTDHCPLCKITFNAKLTLQDHLFTKSHIELLKQSEDCHDGPLPTNMLARLTSPVPVPAQQPQREGRSGPTSSRRQADGQDRPTKMPSSEQATSRKAGSSAAGVKSEPMSASSVGATSQQGMQAAAAMQMGPFGDLGAMMMSDPNMMAYMYASMNPYYNPAAMPGLLNPYAGLGGFYDPAVMGTSLQMLQLPPGVGELIYAKLNVQERGAGGGQSAVAFAQDGKRLSDLRECVAPADFACATSSQTDIGGVCRKCQMVFPTEANCKAHQASMCYPGTKDGKNVLKLQQIHFHCSACQKQYATISEFKNHCNSSSHQKNRQSQATPSFKRNQSSVVVGDDGGSSSKRPRHE
ncbi:Zinc finger homeobox protein 4 [Hypsibius exemplaris]|uniref:Zinc finger homeobox protein 4 n=1 Tax=Hypsibius exemplaris TaxID=2072580 RepID=A0A1W0WBB6_HYPEX|nr:Zinc finger homeobox protein 4 [Hypsibius exemplaris]